MNVFVAHAEADQAAAADLKTFLKSRGMVVETETGEHGFRHLQRSDVVIALWSQKSVFGQHRMQLERRMLDAWAEQQLVLVKLDHGFLPVGLRDLPAVDASFEQGRTLAAWPKVERAAREAMNAALVARQTQERATGEFPPQPGSAPAASSARAPSVGGALPRDEFRSASDGAPQKKVSPSRASKGGGLFGMFRRKEARAPGTGNPALNSLDKMMTDAPTPRPAAPAVEVSVSPPALFISYSHADDAVVSPVVAIVESHGRTVWIDKTGINTGDGWAGEIVKAIKAAHGVVVMCSKHSFESDHVKREVYLADKYKKPMAPMFLEQAAPPEDFEYFFANVQWLELWKLPEADRAAAIGQALKAV